MIVLTAPSGAGKTTLARHLLATFPELAFSVSATTRAPRQGEANGQAYYFQTPEVFKENISEKQFIEYEEVYPNQFYGTLRSEITRLWAANKTILFDIDVKGATNLKAAFADQCLTIFVKPPSPEALFARLRARQTEDSTALERRIARATLELSYEHNFDRILLNDDLEEAKQVLELLVKKYINI